MNRRVLFGIVCFLVFITVIIVYVALQPTGETSEIPNPENTFVSPTNPPTTIPPLVVPQCPPSNTNDSIFELKNVRVEVADLLDALQNCTHIRIIRLLDVEAIGRINGRKVVLPRLQEFTWNRIMFEQDLQSESNDYIKQKLNQTELRSEFLFFDMESGASTNDLSGALSLHRLQLSIRGRIFLRIFRGDGEVKLAHLVGPVANTILEILYNDSNFQLRNLTTDLVTINLNLIPVTHLKVLKFHYGSLYSNKSLNMSSFIRRCVFLEEIYFHIFESPEFVTLATEDLRGLGYLTRILFKYGGPQLKSNHFLASPGVGLPQVEYFGLNADFGIVDPILIQDFPRIFPNLKEFSFEAYDFKYYHPVLYEAFRIQSLRSIKVVRYTNHSETTGEHSHVVSSVLAHAGIRTGQLNFLLTKNNEGTWVGRELRHTEIEDAFAV